jgi:hypothetical protein
MDSVERRLPTYRPPRCGAIRNNAARGSRGAGRASEHCAVWLNELRTQESECFADVLSPLRGRELTSPADRGLEHVQSLSMVVHALRRQGADVVTPTVYRVACPAASAADSRPMLKMTDLIAGRDLDAATFPSAPAVAARMDAGGSAGRCEDVTSTFHAALVAACVGLGQSLSARGRQCALDPSPVAHDAAVQKSGGIRTVGSPSRTSDWRSQAVSRSRVMAGSAAVSLSRRSRS